MRVSAVLVTCVVFAGCGAQTGSRPDGHEKERDVDKVVQSQEILSCMTVAERLPRMSPVIRTAVQVAGADHRAVERAQQAGIIRTP
jgi:hypothetical protein